MVVNVPRESVTSDKCLIESQKVVLTKRGRGGGFSIEDENWIELRNTVW